jgi:uncharacterized coiled-coil protein SlyX
MVNYFKTNKQLQKEIDDLKMDCQSKINITMGNKKNEIEKLQWELDRVTYLFKNQPDPTNEAIDRLRKQVISHENAIENQNKLITEQNKTIENQKQRIAELQDMLISLQENKLATDKAVL